MSKRAKRRQRGRDRTKKQIAQKLLALQGELSGTNFRIEINVSPFLQAMSRVVEVLESEEFKQRVREEVECVFQASYTAARIACQASPRRIPFEHLPVLDGLRFPSFDEQIRWEPLKRSPSAKLKDWCDRNGYTDLFYEDGEWWAFPPNGVMPLQLSVVSDYWGYNK